jgi:hypothetical protein
MAKWSESSIVDGVQIEGYILYMDDGHHGEYKMVFNGTGNPLRINYLVSNLTAGLPYRF